ncbi:hypothetical protein A2U01_0060287, partial [Trifolium medium]|nr:hypothetical protein [Trifolium medium]
HLGVIDDRHVVRHYKANKPEQQEEAPPPEEAHPHPTGPAIDLSLQTWFYHTWDQNAANYRAMTSLHESMYQLHLQGSVMTPPEFHAHNNWPGDSPYFGDGVGTSAAGA